MLTKRQNRIIKILLDSNHPVKNNDLAGLLRVSDRTVRSDVRAINEEYELTGYAVESGDEGYFLTAEDIRFFLDEFQKILMTSSNPYDSRELRMIYMIIQLLWADIPIRVDDLADSMFFSRSTISADIKVMREKYFANNGLTLSIQPHGLIVEGREGNKRDVLGRIVLEAYEDGDIGFVKQLMISIGIFKNEDFIWLYDHFIEVFDHQHILLTDRGMFLFTLENLIVYNRISSGMHIKEQRKTDADLDLKYIEIEDHFKIEIDEKERSYITSRIAVRNQISYANCGNLEQANAVIQIFLKELSETYEIDLNVLKKHQRALTAHLMAMIERLKQNIRLDTKMIDDIRLVYPYAFEAATSIIKILKEQMDLDVNETEISYIAVHLAVIMDSMRTKAKAVVLCSSGIGTSMLIKKRLENAFNDSLTVVGPYPVYQLNHVLSEHSDIDVILSTIPISADSGKPTLQISPLFSKDDYQKIDSFLSRFGRKNKTDNELMKEEMFHIFRHGESRDEILEVMSRDLFEAGCITDIKEFICSVKERDALYSTVYNKVWLPHPMKILAVHTGIAVSLVRKNSEFEIVFLLAVCRTDTVVFESIYDKILALIDDQALFGKLSSCTTWEEFLEVFSSI